MYSLQFGGIPPARVAKTMTESRLLKKDLFGEIRAEGSGAQQQIVRDSRSADRWLRWLARRLMRREARALAVLEGTGGVPELIRIERDHLVRSLVPGEPLQQGKPTDPGYFRVAASLLRRIHGMNVVHNDLAKEPNLLLQPDGSPAFVDFQLAWHCQRRYRLFRVLAYEDIRHLLKHKRTYCSEHLTQRELAILANRSLLSRIWKATVKPVYLFITRRVLGWADREGTHERDSDRFQERS
jgi:RIO-like serine/threonine protein kinase